MPYTLWSHGRLLGHTDLGFRANTESVKFGWFYPTETGEGAMHVVTDCSRIMLERGDVDLVTLSADLCSASSRIEAMSLELEKDPSFASAWAQLGTAYSLLPTPYVKAPDSPP